MKPANLQKLYANYGRTPDAEIRKLLKCIYLVHLTHKGPGTPFGYYKFNKKLMKEILKAPRSISHTFDVKIATFIDGLKKYKEIKILVKSSSPFLLKPDIGEVFDQMSKEDKKTIRAIFTDIHTSKEIACTGSQHHILTAVLLK